MHTKTRPALMVRIVPACALAILVPYLLSCGMRDESGPVRVGSVLDLTGAGASYGTKMQTAFNLAIEEANSQGGVAGRPVKLVVEDFQWDPGLALAAYRKLTGVESVSLIVGITGSKHAIPIAEASKKDNVVIVDALTSSPTLTTDGGPNYFRVMPSDAMAGQYNVGWALESGMKRPALIYVEDEWGASYRNAVQNTLRAKGFAEVPAIGVAAGTRDFRTQVEQLRQTSPDSVFLLVYAQEGGSFMQQARQAGLQATVYGSDNLSADEFVAVGASLVEGVRVALPAPASGTGYDDFVARYRKRYGEVPDAILIKSYDAMGVALKALQEAGLKPDAIRAYLHSPQFSYPGISGEIRFDQNGDLVSQKYSRMIYRAGKLVDFS
jgi:branched-chain amino acid transport system substrate-binding protein